MTVKTAAVNLPYGGAWAASASTPRNSPKEPEKVAPLHQLRRHIIGPHTDIPAPDVATAAQTAG
jgi:glutamate dehydrogenase (NAD(P)+)